MFRFILQRLLWWLPTAFVILLFVYAMLFYGAGDPIRLIFLRAPGDVAWDPERIEAMREEAGLDRPFYVQFGEYVWNLLQGDFGNSLVHKRSVNDMIKVALPVSVQMGVAATFIVALVGIPLGVLAAFYKNTWLDHSILGGALGCWAIPTFVAGPLLMIVLVIWLGIMDVPYGWDGLFSTTVIVPLLVLAFRPTAIVVRQARSAVLEVLGEDFIRTAHAKGISNWLVITRHILRPTLAPVITQLGIILSFMIQGAILLEVVFGIPGLGRLVVNSVVDSDYPVVLAVVLLGSFLVTGANLFVDITYPILDPRARQAQVKDE
jgi:peptide/nickel transport system permease protein